MSLKRIMDKLDVNLEKIIIFFVLCYVFVEYD